MSAGNPGALEQEQRFEQQREKAQAVYIRLEQALGLPEWGPAQPPLDELVSTILSQNTNDRNRDLAYTRLRERFAIMGSRARRRYR